MTGVLRALLALQAGPRRLCCFWTVPAAPRWAPRSPHCAFATDGQSQKENERTVQQLCKLSVDLRKIRRWKGWVLLQEDSYVEEVVRVLQGLGTDAVAVASVLERYPEAVLCSPAAVATQKDLWQLVCGSERELARLIERFPEAFFTIQDQENLELNIRLFQELGLRNVVISRLLTTATSVFHHPAEKNKQMVRVLQESYLHRGGAEANLKVWLLKLLSQNPFILFSSPAAVRETLESLQEQGFTNSEILQLLSKLKGFLFQLCPRGIQNSISFSKNALECTDRDLKQLVLKCPALLYYSVPVLEERIRGLVQEGVSIAQIREAPAVLELTPQVVQYRIRKLSSSGYRIQDGHLADLSGTKREFEANFGKIQAKRERPLFNPVAPLDVEG
ncbi:transcription termination factor 2, mitochondrial [Cavia porcellus]|uniref:Mitochondrial transcription termination factor 2 n=1 Tax=Cavia porcellus TaxID=10141 RepID=H0V904_CAVPO|nr:transcription termination factor 2, mitochondrial [Cavia porcellus]